MARLGLERTVVDAAVLERTAARLGQAGVVLPTIAQLKDPATIPAAIRAGLADVDPDAANALNLFRVHWFNGADRKSLVVLPDHLELPPELTGVKARIVLALGNRFPMIGAHKVLPAYGCLVPRLVTGQFDPARDRAVWPSTGNYCRGGVAISRILGCRGTAVLPENMSRERFDWLDRWVGDPSDIVRTPGSESNVKEIYDTCAALDRDPTNIIFNQFCEFGNYLIHRVCTGVAMEKLFVALTQGRPGAKLAAFVSASGSSGTLAAGDHLKKKLGARIVAVEAVECPTLLYNRLRRAQHPRHRRQARSLYPQRDEHRRGDRRQRPGDRHTDGAVQYRSRAEIPDRASRDRCRARRPTRQFRPVVLVQHAGRDQDRQIFRSRSRRCHPHCRD